MEGKFNPINHCFPALQYVEKLEKILRFVIKEKALSLEDLDNIWAAQVCMTKNLYKVLAI